MIYKTGLSSVYSYAQNLSRTSPSTTSPIGKVFGVITTPNTPTPELYNTNGGSNGIGAIFYQDYNDPAVRNKEKEDPSKCNVAFPLFPGIQDYPALGELVYLVDGPVSDNQYFPSPSQKYYITAINLWNDNQQNSPLYKTLGLTFEENSDVRRLLAFEGDRIFQGRKGNGIRFGTTVSFHSDLNEWSSVGKNGDPITILVNGYVTTDTESSAPNVEEINKEKSSIWMTSSQKIPLLFGSSIINPRNSSPSPDSFVLPQIIMNSDRITLNSKKENILLSSIKNIEISSNSVINLNAGEIIHLHLDTSKSGRICLGTQENGSYPSEPVLLGDKTHDLLVSMCDTLRRVGGFLGQVVIPTTEGGMEAVACTSAGQQLLSDIEGLSRKLENICSNKVFTI